MTSSTWRCPTASSSSVRRPSPHADQVRFSHSGGITIVAINTAGNSGAEMQIELAGVINLADGDFLL